MIYLQTKILKSCRKCLCINSTDRWAGWAHHQTNYRANFSFQQSDGALRYIHLPKTSLEKYIIEPKTGHFNDFSHTQYIRAETRQTYSALLQYDILPKQIVLEIPTTRGCQMYLRQLASLGSQSHFSHLMLFLSLTTDGPTGNRRFRGPQHSLLFYLFHSTPYRRRVYKNHAHKVNGAMKVMIGLLVDDLPFKYPERLSIFAYFSHQQKQRMHATKSIRFCCVCRQIMPTHVQTKRHRTILSGHASCLEKYYYPELGGFSFHKHHDRYHGAKISHGLDEPDIHGTTLFTWGLSMMKHLIKIDELDFLTEIKSWKRSYENFLFISWFMCAKQSNKTTIDFLGNLTFFMEWILQRATDTKL